jgi:TrmH family RNA methyltransferase
MSISKSTQSFVKQLALKKYRLMHNSFVVEGPKIITELIGKGFIPQQLWATEKHISIFSVSGEPISEGDMKKISSQKSPSGALAVFSSTIFEKAWQKRKKSGLFVYLDGIQDPGNLGTIIRTADWFGVEEIFANEGTADIENQKVIQASMGSVFNLPTTYVKRDNWFNQNKGLNFYATHLNGENMYPLKPQKPAVILIGNESKGLHSSLINEQTKLLKIPGYGQAESLNAAIATGIVLAEFRRNW